MANFSIAKKVTKQRIKRMSERLKTDDDSSLEFQEALKQEILKETQLAIFNTTIPGLITNAKQKKSSTQNKTLLNDKQKKQVTLLAAIIIQSVLEKKLTKDETCLLIVQIVNALGLKDSDFKEFTNKYYIENDDEDEDDYDGDEEDD
jgi:uncharacterized membrane-anchored protein YjiN (DUF445 family)